MIFPLNLQYVSFSYEIVEMLNFLDRLDFFENLYKCFGLELLDNRNLTFTVGFISEMYVYFHLNLAQSF